MGRNCPASLSCGLTGYSKFRQVLAALLLLRVVGVGLPTPGGFKVRNLLQLGSEREHPHSPRTTCSCVPWNPCAYACKDRRTVADRILRT